MPPRLPKTISLLLVMLVLMAAPAFAARIVISPADFNNAHPIKRLHRGLNIQLIGNNLQWDASVPAEPDFYDVAADPQFIDTIKNLGAGSLRIPGGADANSFAIESGDAWVSWAIGADNLYNADVEWNSWWDFYRAVGTPALMTTINVYKNGNPDLNNWTHPQDAAVWLNHFKAAENLGGGYWEMGNETYIEDSVPGMTFIPEHVGDKHSYPYRACRFAEALHQADPSAIMLWPKLCGLCRNST